MYGHRLTSAYGESAPAVWCVEIEKLTSEQFRRGIARLQSRHADPVDERQLGWPPTLAEFLRWCTAEPAPAPEHREFKPLGLPEPEDVREARLARGREHIATMKAMLRSKGK